MLLDPRNSAEFDLRAAAPRRVYVIASSPRSGSTYLCRLLWLSRGAGAPKEYLNPMQLRDWEVRLGDTALSRWRHRQLRGAAIGLAGRGRWSDARLRRYLDRVQDRRTDPSGWFGLKIHHHHLQRWFLHAGRDPVSWLAPQRWIWIRRQDQVAQAVSLARALQTGRWISTQLERRPPRYRRRMIAHLLSQLVAQDRGWQALLSQQPRPPLVLTYESLREDPESVLRQALGALSLPPPPTLPIPELRPQADAQSLEWIQRFRAGH